MAYNARSQSRSTSAKKTFAKEGAISAKSSSEKIVACRERLGGKHAAQDERRRKDLGSFYSPPTMEFDGHGTPRLTGRSRMT